MFGRTHVVVDVVVGLLLVVLVVVLQAAGVVAVVALVAVGLLGARAVLRPRQCQATGHTTR